MTFQEIVRTMIKETNMAKHFWEEAMNITSYVQNKISIMPILKNIPYELCKGRKSNISYLHPFFEVHVLF